MSTRSFTAGERHRRDGRGQGLARVLDHLGGEDLGILHQPPLDFGMERVDRIGQRVVMLSHGGRHLPEESPQHVLEQRLLILAAVPQQMGGDVVVGEIGGPRTLPLDGYALDAQLPVGPHRRPWARHMGQGSPPE